MGAKWYVTNSLHPFLPADHPYPTHSKLLPRAANKPNANVLNLTDHPHLAPSESHAAAAAVYLPLLSPTNTCVSAVVAAGALCLLRESHLRSNRSHRAKISVANPTFNYPPITNCRGCEPHNTRTGPTSGKHEICPTSVSRRFWEKISHTLGEGEHEKGRVIALCHCMLPTYVTYPKMSFSPPYEDIDRVPREKKSNLEFPKSSKMRRYLVT